MIDHVSVVASIPVGSIEDLALVPKALEDGADLVELRLDYLKGLNLEVLRKEILPKVPKAKVIITVRDQREGGVNAIPNQERIALLKAASEAGCCVDVEVKSVEHLRSTIDHTVRRDSRTIVSIHDPTTKSAKELGARVPIWARRSAWVVKGAYPARTWGELCDMVGASSSVRRDAERHAMMGIGPFGSVSRYILPSYGTSLVYCSCGKATAPGQVALGDFLPVLRSVGAQERESWLGLLGNGISYSISPQIQNAALRALGINWAYVPFDIPPESVEFLRQLKDTRQGPRPVGLNVTTPYKEKVVGLMDDLDSEAKAVGAVNTILVGERLLGANTDVGGYEDALSGSGAPTHETTLVIGAGGAARAAAYVAHKHGAKLWVADRTPAKAEALAKEFGAERVAGGLDAAALAPRATLVVNCTPATATEDPLRLAKFSDSQYVMDMVYRPRVTKLLEHARDDGAHTIEGLEMLVAQAARSLELWTGREAPRGVMMKAAREALESQGQRYTDAHRLAAAAR